MLHDMDLETSHNTAIWTRVPSLDRTSKNLGHEQLLIKKMPRPRLFKTVLPFWFLENEINLKQPKVIVMLRNPKDVLVSMYHFMNNLFPGFASSFDVWYEYFQARYVLHADWFDHVLGWWANKDRPNFLILKYEDLLENLHREIKKVANFLGKDITDAYIDRLVQVTSFNEMSKHPGTNLTLTQMA